MLKLWGSAAIALLLASSANGEETVTWKDDVQGWSVAIDRTIDNSCFIISGFEDDLFLRFQFNAAQQNVQFIVASVRWDSLQTGEDYDLEVAFGDLEAWSGTAKGHRWNEILPSLVLSVPITDQQASNFMDDFTATDSVRITHDGSEIAHLALSGASAAISSMLDCQATMAQANKTRQETNDPFAEKPDPI
ncbi:MAG: hypothetical protein AAF718_06340 [Pseudomonadota bacterium]